MNRHPSPVRSKALKLGSWLALILMILLIAFPMARPEEDASVVGRIATCWECQLHKYPILADFLFAGDADCYENVQLFQVPGTTPSLTVLMGGVEGEKIELYPYDTKEKLHQLFQDQGLKKKSEEDCDEVFRKKKIERTPSQIEITPEILARLYAEAGYDDEAEL